MHIAKSTQEAYDLSLQIVMPCCYNFSFDLFFSLPLFHLSHYFPFTFSAYILPFIVIAFSEYSVSSLLKGKTCCVCSYIFCPCLQWLYSSLKHYSSQGELSAFWISALFTTSKWYPQVFNCSYKRHRYCTITKQCSIHFDKSAVFFSPKRRLLPVQKKKCFKHVDCIKQILKYAKGQSWHYAMFPIFIFHNNL